MFRMTNGNFQDKAKKQHTYYENASIQENLFELSNHANEKLLGVKTMQINKKNQS